MPWNRGWPAILGACLVAFIVGIYVGESKRLVVNIQDCVKYRGMDEGLWSMPRYD